MFTGIISALGTVQEITPRQDGRDTRLAIAAPWPEMESIPLGASIACSGCCLTVVAVGKNWFAVEASGETLARTTLGAWRPGQLVNLERALRLGDELGGHLVSGHVDGVAEILSAAAEGGSTRWRFRLPRPLARFVAEKGSVAVDGVSLTVNAVEGEEFAVNVIGHTALVTNFSRLAPGDRVNIEIDLLARYVARLQEGA
uniref:Riboflavin synthase n=1 Tax=Acidicaldus sp. TaxID=1872105 RepID=A0A8J4HCW1_9PROT